MTNFVLVLLTTNSSGNRVNIIALTVAQVRLQGRRRFLLSPFRLRCFNYGALIASFAGASARYKIAISATRCTEEHVQSFSQTAMWNASLGKHDTRKNSPVISLNYIFFAAWFRNSDSYECLICSLSYRAEFLLTSESNPPLRQINPLNDDMNTRLIHYNS